MNEKGQAVTGQADGFLRVHPWAILKLCLCGSHSSPCPRRVSTLGDGRLFAWDCICLAKRGSSASLAVLLVCLETHDGKLWLACAGEQKWLVWLGKLLGSSEQDEDWKVETKRACSVQLRRERIIMN